MSSLRLAAVGVCAAVLAGCGYSAYAVRAVPRIAADNVGQPVSRLQDAFGEPRKIDSSSAKQVYVWFIPQQPAGAPAGFHGCELEVSVDPRSQRVLGYSLSNIGWSKCREVERRILVAQRWRQLHGVTRPQPHCYTRARRDVAHPEVLLFGISILSLVIQAIFIVHVIKTGRNTLWIVAIALLPLVGALAYVVVELLPQFIGGKTARRATSRVERMMDPDRDLRRAGVEVEISGNLDARRRYAEELFARRRFEEALEAYRGGLKGIFEHDPTLLLGMAQVQFAISDFAAASTTLERLREHNADFKSADAALLYARTLESQGALEEAESIYAAIAPGFPGAEARLRYGLLLKRRGKLQQARAVFTDLVDGARIGPQHYRKAQAEWLAHARRETR